MKLDDATELAIIKHALDADSVTVLRDMFTALSSSLEAMEAALGEAQPCVLAALNRVFPQDPQRTVLCALVAKIGALLKGGDR